ncbi:MAG TPA: hypothetical protein VHZ28_12110 [Terracidiphilus sp.]|jgi:hypothetical protein|nr:hypothetical protein [Terracidiphilus sp.]
MPDRRLTLSKLSLTLVLLSGTALLAEPQRPAPPPAAPPAPVLNDKDVASTQAEVIRLLKLSPTLTTVVSHDPTLLANQEYVTRNNPQLAAFLTAHPEVARNPEYYLFSHLAHEPGEPDEVLERAVWPDLYRVRNDSEGSWNAFTRDLSPLLAFFGFLVALTWMVRVFVENRRWSRVFKLQSEVHGRLIDKFSTNQELAAYMETDAGRRFLEAAPIAVNLENGQRVPNAVARVLTPLQIGVVMVLLGAGLLALRHASPDMDVPMLVFGMVVLMPGIGFILSAGLTWLLAARLGLMPPATGDTQSGSSYGHKL